MCGVMSFLCKCCDIFRSLYYKDLYENLVKYNGEKVNTLVRGEQVDDLDNSGFKWEFDTNSIDLESGQVQISERTEVITRQPLATIQKTKVWIEHEKTPVKNVRVRVPGKRHLPNNDLIQHLSELRDIVISRCTVRIFSR